MTSIVDRPVTAANGTRRLAKINTAGPTPITAEAESSPARRIAPLHCSANGAVPLNDVPASHLVLWA